ncbi:MAG: hypothetical protein U0172_07275 [Nitrospiraceae bacterium]
MTVRAVLRDANHNHTLEVGERFTLELDVANQGPVAAEQVDVHVDGTPSVVDQLHAPIHIGTLPAGEHRRLVLSGTVPTLASSEQAEIVLTVRTPNDASAASRKRQFLLGVRAGASAVDVRSIAIDHPPSVKKGHAQTDAVAIAVGVGTYRDPLVATSPLAARDATVVGHYFKRTFGIPTDRIKVLTDAQALRDDLAQVFEQWLPSKAKTHPVVYVYVAGRAAVDPQTGAVALVPHDGQPGSQYRLYPLSRLHAALAALPQARAVVILDLSLEPSGTALDTAAVPTWKPEIRHALDGRLLQIVGNTGLQDAHELPAPQHGLFTFYVLKALSGEADASHTGRVLWKDLCGYVSSQVQQQAQELFGQPQVSFCEPDPQTLPGFEALAVMPTVDRKGSAPVR